MKIDKFYGGNIKFIKTDNLRENKITSHFNHTLTEEGNKEVKRSSLKAGDIITTIIGATFEIVGRTSIIQKEILPANINQNIALIRPKKDAINADYLNIYLNTKYGRNLLYWQSRQTGQVNLNCREVERIYVPLFKTLETIIDKIVHKIEALKISAKLLYTQAENLLIEEVRLQDFLPSQEAVNIKSFKNSFSATGRLDAEYYQPKYDDILEKVYEYKNGFGTIFSDCNLKAQNFKPKDEKRYKYIELSNIGMTGDIMGCTTDLGKELPSRARRIVKVGDVIVSSIEGSLDSCALITKEYNDSLCSTGFYVIKSKKINSETLLVLFKSKLMQNLLKQNCSGTILTSINKNDFLNIPIPIIDFEVQNDIRDSIQQSFALKKQSEHLLEIAKKAVEIAIEENEEIAIEFINDNTKK